MGVISLLTKWLYLEKEKPLLALQQEVSLPFGVSCLLKASFLPSHRKWDIGVLF